MDVEITASAGPFMYVLKIAELCAMLYLGSEPESLQERKPGGLIVIVESVPSERKVHEHL